MRPRLKTAPDGARTANAERIARFRARAEAGLSLLEVLARRVELEELLIANRYLDPSQRDDTAEVAHAVERLLEVLIEMHFAELMRDGSQKCRQ
jgi:hypothetical protein